MIRVLIIGCVWPEWNSSAAGLRDRNLVTAFLREGWEVVFGSAAQETSYTTELQNMGVKTQKVVVNDPSFDHFITQLQPDLVVFDRFVTEEQYGWRVEESVPNAIRILDTVDLHFLRKGREEKLKEGRSLQDIAECKFHLKSEAAIREIASIYRCDGTLILSDFEMKLLVQEFQIPEELIFLSRFYYEEPAVPAGFQERTGFSIIGNFRHPPNTDGFRWFHDEIWPLIRRDIPQAQVSIYGAYPPRELMALHNERAGFLMKGTVPDQYSALAQHRVNLAPLRYGAGIKGKISDGWWTGTPVVTTPIGAEGMFGALPFAGEIAHDPLQFAKASVSLYQNEQAWLIAQRNALEIIRKLYSENTHVGDLTDWLKSIRRHLELRRSSNFIGRILRHQSHRSTKYMSKWIEAKNKWGQV